MSTTDPKKIAFRGTTNRDLQKHIDSYFTTLGGINLEGLNYTSSNYYYFIDNSGEIIRVAKLPVGYTEREPGDYFKDSLGGIKNKRKFAFLGSEYPEIQEAMINFFVKLGATNRQKLLCRYKDMYYFIDETNNIDNSLILPEGYIHQLHSYLNIMKNPEEKIPEYVECIKPLLHSTVGKIYKVIDSKNCESDRLDYKYSWQENQFKPSTKEAYEAQNNSLKAAEYIPQVGDYVIMEKAGGWGYSPDNNGCVAIVSRIGKNIVNRDEVFSIWGEVINPNNNNSRGVKFSDIPQFGYNKEVIFRKALPHEIPGSNIKVEPQLQVTEWSKGTYAVGIKGNFHVYSNSDQPQPVIKGKVYIIEKDSLDNKLDLKDSCYWAYKENFKWFATKEEAIDFSKNLVISESKESKAYPITPKEVFSIEAIEKQIKKNKFQEVHEIKIVEEKLLKKTKSKLFNI